MKGDEAEKLNQQMPAGHIAGVATDHEGEVVVVATDGRVWAYTHGHRGASGGWQNMDPVPGSQAATVLRRIRRRDDDDR